MTLKELATREMLTVETMEVHIEKTIRQGGEPVESLIEISVDEVEVKQFI